MKIRILHETELDLLEGYSFYEMQAVGVGDYFLDSLYADIESLLIYANSHQIHFGYHRLLARRFPFAIFYRVNVEEIEVWAVLDCRQDPAKMENRLR
jgi:plasmid stabilization system protein ParE